MHHSWVQTGPQRFILTRFLELNDVLRTQPAGRAAFHALLRSGGKDFRILILAEMEIAFCGGQFGSSDFADLAISLGKIPIAIGTAISRIFLLTGPTVKSTLFFILYQNIMKK